MQSVLRLGLPVVVNHASFALMQFTDAWIAGQLGSTELAAIATATVLSGVLMVLGMEALTSLTAQVAQTLGKGRAAFAGAITWQGIYCGILFGWLCLVYYPTSGVLFRTLFQNQSDQLVRLEMDFFEISLLGIGPLMVSTAIGNFFTALGRTGTLLSVTLMGVVANIFLSYFLAFGIGGFPKLGLPGIAWGTVWATALQMVVLLLLFIGPSRMRREFGSLKASFSRKRSARLLRTALPAGLHGCVDYVAWAVVLTWLISFSGEAHLAAQAIMVRCITLSFLPAEGLATGLSTLVGRAVGSRDYLLARRYTQAAFFLIAGWMSLMALVYFVFGGHIVRLFTADEAVVAAGTTAILWVAGFQFFDAMNVTYSNALQGAGDTAWPSAVNFIISLVILLGGGLAVVTFLPASASSGVWAAATLYVIAHGLLYGLRWKSRSWQDRRFIQ